MEQKYTYYDYLRHELFEVLIPRMLYKGTGEENSQFFQLLFRENKQLIRDMFQTLCEDDSVPYPYHDTDFDTEILRRGGIQFLQIVLPPGSPEISDVLRAYLMCATKGDGSPIIKYFVIRRFEDGSVFILNITPEAEELLGEELTEHIGDMEYEYWRLVRDFARMVIRDMRAGTKQKNADLKNGESVDGTITSGQLEAFFQWLQEKEAVE